MSEVDEQAAGTSAVLQAQADAAPAGIVRADEVLPLVHVIEAALLVSPEPLTVDRLQLLFGDAAPPKDALESALATVSERCADRAYELIRVASGYRFQVRQALAPWVGRLYAERPARYSRALLETLALVAYRQPVTRGDIEEVRGVAVSTGIMRTLLERGWIHVVGYRDVPGRPALYGTTKAFLDYFSLTTLEQLPPLSEVRDLDQAGRELELALGLDPSPEDAVRAIGNDGSAPADESAAAAPADATPADDAPGMVAALVAPEVDGQQSPPANESNAPTDAHADADMIATVPGAATNDSTESR